MSGLTKFQDFTRISQLISKEKPPLLDYISHLEGAALFQAPARKQKVKSLLYPRF